MSKCAMANRGCFSAGRLCRPGRESKAASKHGAFKAVSRSLIQGSASVGSDGESVQEAAEAAEAGGQRPPESSPLPWGAGGRSFPVRPREAEARPVCCVAPRAEWPGPGVPCGVCPLCGQQCPAPLRPVPTCTGTLSAGSGRPRLPRVRHDGSRPLAPWGGNVGAWRPLCFCSGAQRAEATQPRSPVASCPPSRRFSLSLDWGKPAAWSLSGREFGGPRWFGRR